MAKLALRGEKSKGEITRKESKIHHFPLELESLLQL